MMPHFSYYLFFFAIIGAIGMALGSRKVSAHERKQRWLKYFVYLGITSMLLTGFYYDFHLALLGIIILFAFVEWILVTRRSTICFFPVIGSFLYLVIVSAGLFLFGQTFTSSFLIYIYCQVLLFDAFSQVMGQLFGKRLLVPKISPGKTVGGLLGGILFCIVFAIAARSWVRFDLLTAGVSGLVTAASCFTGDLLASWYKRKTGVKNYSDWLPGQGGFLDRFDSLLLTGTIYYIFSLLHFLV